MGDYEIDGESCWFVTHDRMVEGLEQNEFLDVGEHDNYLFGTTIESVRGVMAENKLCVLDVRPEVRQMQSRCCHNLRTPDVRAFQALKLLHNSTEFLPYVIYVAPPPPDEDNVILVQNGRASQNIELAVSISTSASDSTILFSGYHLPVSSINHEHLPKQKKDVACQSACVCELNMKVTI